MKSRKRREKFVSTYEAKYMYETKYIKYKLSQYKGYTRPCVIRCPTHKKVELPSFDSIMESVTGCPLCDLALNPNNLDLNPSNPEPNPSNPDLNSKTTEYTLAVAQRFVEEMERLGLSKDSLSNRTLIPRAIITKILKGTTHINSIYLHNLLMAGFDILYLLTGNRNPKLFDNS